MNRKNGKVAAEDIKESQRTGAPSEFIAQVAAISCAETQQPDTTSADQKRRYVGSRNEDQMEVFAVTRIGNPRLLLQLSHIEMNVSSWTEFARHIPFCSRPGRIHAPAACDGGLPARPNFPHSLRRASGVEDGDPSQGCPRRSRLQECAACVFKHPGVAFSRRRSPSHELSVRGGICRFCKP